jgi:hypothetical protein
MTISISPTFPPPTVGTVITATITVTNPQSIPVRSLTLFWGDGSQTSLGAPQSGTVSAQKVYSRVGEFKIRAELVDANGEVSVTETQVVIQ